MAFTKKIYTIPSFLEDVAVLVRRLDRIVSIQSGNALDPAFREEIMVSVARANACRYCVFAHETAALEEGVESNVLASIADPTADPRDANLDHDTWTALAYARSLAEADFDPERVSPDLEAEVRATLGDEMRATIETTARLMTLMNRTGNTVDALMARLGGDAAPHSHVCDEIAITGLWAIGAIATSVKLMRARGESPSALLRSFRRLDASLPGGMVYSSRPSAN
jgi:AhpD family alkylhydroperoxidase